MPPRVSLGGVKQSPDATEISRVSRSKDPPASKEAWGIVSASAAFTAPDAMLLKLDERETEVEVAVGYSWDVDGRVKRSGLGKAAPSKTLWPLGLRLSTLAIKREAHSHLLL